MLQGIARPKGRGRGPAFVAALAVAALGPLSPQSAFAEVLFVSPDTGAASVLAVNGGNTFLVLSPSVPPSGDNDWLRGDFADAFWSINPAALFTPNLFGLPVLLFPAPADSDIVNVDNAEWGRPPAGSGEIHVDNAEWSRPPK